MTPVTGAELSTAALLLVVGEELGVTEHRHRLVLVPQGEGCTALQLLLVLRTHGQDDRDGLVCHPTWKRKATESYKILY